MDLKIKEYYIRNTYENELKVQGYSNIIGIDEVGRGPLAGPLCIGAVMLDFETPIYGLKDSKKLSKKKICELSLEIKKKAIEYHTVYVMPQTIDKYGMSKAYKMAIKKLISKFQNRIDYILIDYERIESKKIPSLSITKGDDKSNSIAAASIVAKDKRDMYMAKISKKYPQYGFEKNVGYGTLEHREAIEKYGAIEKVHRFSFKPIRKG